MVIKWNRWYQLNDINPKEYICGHCGNQVGSNKGYWHQDNHGYIYICSTCGMPTYMYSNIQIPGPISGRNINHLPENVDTIYKEMREDIKNSAYTSAVLLGRKLIMHLAVDVAGAEEGKTFVNYVEHLKGSGYIPPNGDKALEFMRKIGNEKIMKLKLAEKTKQIKLLDL
ncbi:hypothetical protein HY410_00375 [Candidatus Gottesmanbacteria bacterium]|nr:hypothetical protein [Candidatus Gottesmanbacteria bacterium]